MSSIFAVSFCVMGSAEINFRSARMISQQFQPTSTTLHRRLEDGPKASPSRNPIAVLVTAFAVPLAIYYFASRDVACSDRPRRLFCERLKAFLNSLHGHLPAVTVAPVLLDQIGGLSARYPVFEGKHKRAKSAPQVREKQPIRESRHSSAILLSEVHTAHLTLTYPSRTAGDLLLEANELDTERLGHFC